MRLGLPGPHRSRSALELIEATGAKQAGRQIANRPDVSRGRTAETLQSFSRLEHARGHYSKRTTSRTR